jgi:TRAP-type C4-dicarboxylate transport system substrate-binding protein
MSLRMRVIGLMAAACISAFAQAPAAVAQDTIKLTLATGIVPTVPTSWLVKDFIAPRLKRYSNGRISTNVQISGSLCSEHKCVEQAKLKQSISALCRAAISARSGPRSTF